MPEKPPQQEATIFSCTDASGILRHKLDIHQVNPIDESDVFGVAISCFEREYTPILEQIWFLLFLAPRRPIHPTVSRSIVFSIRSYRYHQF